MTVYFSELIFIVTIFNACFFIFRVFDILINHRRKDSTIFSLNKTSKHITCIYSIQIVRIIHKQSPILIVKTQIIRNESLFHSHYPPRYRVSLSTLYLCNHGYETDGHNN